MNGYTNGRRFGVSTGVSRCHGPFVRVQSAPNSDPHLPPSEGVAMNVRLAHVGVAVRSIVDARIFYEEVLGLEVESVEEIESEGVKVALLPFPGGEIELIEPLSDDTPVGRFLEKHGEGLHHLSFEVPDVRRSIAAGIKRGVETVGEAPRKGAEGREIAFFHPLFTHGVLIEVCGAAVAGARRRDGDETG